MSGPARVIVVGAGAIGGTVAALLHEAGVDCVVVADPGRSAHARAVAERGIALRFPDPAASRLVRVQTMPSLVACAPTPRDLVIVATMGQHTAAAVDALAPAVPVASFQNGLLPLRVLAAHGHPVLAAVVWVPAERREPGVIALPGQPGPGAVLLGEWGGGRAMVGSAADADRDGWAGWLALRIGGGLRCEVEPDIAPWVRAKLLSNLGGIVVALCDEPPLDVIEAAGAEAVAVWEAAGEGYRTVTDLADRVGSFHTVAVDGRLRVGGSTRGALARGEELETAALHGEVVAEGARLGVPTPVNAALIAIAARAAREGWAPGSVTGEGLRRLLARP